MTFSNTQPEILVIGAGPGGAAAAWFLAQAGRQVLLVDRAEFPRDKTCGDGLPPLAVQTLRYMGILPEIEAAHPARIDRMRLVGPFGNVLDMPFKDYLPSEANYSLVLPRLVLDDILRKHAIRAGVKYAGSVKIDRIERAGDSITAIRGMSPHGPIELKPRQIILAVGANTGLLEREGFLRHRPAMMRAARAYYKNVETPPDTYIFHFDLAMLPGYGWIFPVGGGRVNAGAGTIQTLWSTRKTAQALLKEFVQRRAHEGGFTQAELDGPVKGFPLRFDFPRERVAGKNWIIVGEATGLVNPLTGEGIDLAMESGLMGAEMVHQDMIKGRTHHGAYQSELSHRFLPMFNGLRALRDILVTPFFLDYVIWQAKQYRFIGERVMKIGLGLEPPQKIFHPLFILEFFMPLSPAHVFGHSQRQFSRRS